MSNFKTAMPLTLRDELLCVGGPSDTIEKRTGAEGLPPRADPEVWAPRTRPYLTTYLRIFVEFLDGHAYNLT